jgi:hypothetical protein
VRSSNDLRGLCIATRRAQRESLAAAGLSPLYSPAFEADGDGGLGAEGDAGPGGGEFCVGEVDAEAAEECGQGDRGFHHREVLADALVRAGTEGEVAVFGEGAGGVVSEETGGAIVAPGR